MTRDQEIVKRLQWRLQGWNPDRLCQWPSHNERCEYDEQGRLIKLHFCKLKLARIPSEVWQFVALQDLFLRDNQLDTLPAEVGNLTNLQTLDLWHNQLRTLPMELWELTSLQTLELGLNQLDTLPAEVGNLTNLQVLDLRDNELNTLPAEFWSLTNLQTLELGGNLFSTLPAEVGNLTNLQVLYLSTNLLSTLPAEVGNLTKLQTLGLHFNQLDTLPATLWSLTSLQTLGLSGNLLSTLPAEVGNLTKLQTLELGGNLFSTLPVQMGNLRNLQVLNLDDNPLQSPPPATIKQGIPAILAYLRNQQRTAATEAARAKASGAIQPLAAIATAPSITSAPTRPITIFYCYAHEDRDLRDRIDKHLGVLKRLGQVTGWYDREIQAGTEWEREIEAHLSTANIILLLVSADFVNSDYCYGEEMQRALQMHEKGEACVLPILLRPVDWQDAPFAKLQILPTGAKPITRWSDPEEALEDVAMQIRAVITTLRTR